LAFSVKFIQALIKTVFFNNKSLFTFIFLSGISTLLGILIIKNKSTNLLKLTWFLNVITLLFFGIKVVQLIQEEKITIALSDNESTYSNYSAKNAPNIYYIILDSYTSDNSLQNYWNFNNSEFTKYLKNKGFYVANSNSNYNWTPFSLASSLNFSYLDFDKETKVSNQHFNKLLHLINNNKATLFLKENGYQIINCSFFDVANQPKYYKDYFFFNDNFFSHTLFSIIYLKIADIYTPNEITYLPKSNLSVISKVKELPFDSTNKKSFVYVHLALPHFPYFFDHKGKQMNLQYANDPANKTKYLEQLIFTNKLVIDCIEAILNNSKSKPVIIIQGDHGFRYLKHKDYLSESFTILNAYYFPDNNYNCLYKSISPVNSFRVVFNKYFDTNMPVLKDSSINVLPKDFFSR
jgi:hypothetical protein